MRSFDLYICVVLITIFAAESNLKYVYNVTSHESSGHYGSKFSNSKIKPTPNLGRRIFGGEEVIDMRNTPFMAFMVRNGTSELQKPMVASCGATIISPKHLLTAAHCVQHCKMTYENDTSGIYGWIFCNDRDPKTYDVYIGGTDASSALSKAEIKKIFVYPKYIYLDDLDDCILNNDIAVVELKDPLQLNDKISAVSLPEFVDMNSTQKLEYKKCNVIGWGLTVDRNVKPPLPTLNRRLKLAEVNLISNKQCVQELKISRPKSHQPNKGLCKFSQLCSLDPDNKNGICKGDSGGPIVCDGVQVGIASWVAASQCVGPHMPNVFSRVEIYIEWIKNIISGVK